MSNQKAFMSYDEAKLMLINNFFEKHPQEAIPEWMQYLLPPNIKFDDKEERLTLSLGDYKYEQFNSKHPKFKKSNTLIHQTPREYITLFKSVLNLKTLKLSVLTDVDFSKLNPLNFDGYQKTNIK